MKKFLAMTLVLLMMMSTATAAVAADVDAEGGTNKTAVTGTCVEGTSESPITYSVDIVWTDLSFTYNEANSPTWDPVNHRYNGDAREAGWVEKTATATITNHSNTAILATFSYTAESGFESADMQFASDEVYVASAETNNQAETASNTVKPTGTLPKGTDNAKIGNITITITQAEMDRDTAQYEMVQLVTEVETYFTGKTEYKVVDSAEVATLGEKYILKSEITSLAEFIADKERSFAVSTTDEEATAIYYEMKAAWDTFKATKLYTKA